MPTIDNTTNIGPATKLVAVTKSDSTTYIPYIRALYIGVGGNVAVQDAEGNSVTFPSVPPGTQLGPFAVSKVLSTGTTASSIVGYQ